MTSEPSRRLFGESELIALRDVLDSGLLWRGNGPEWGGASGVGGSAVDQFEDAFGDWLGLPYVLAVNSGSSANEATIASLGLRPGDEVLCPAASPVFVPLSVLALGCIPVFVDVDPETMLIRPEEIERKSTERTRALVVVHLWGQPAAMREVVEVARKLNLLIVEDCAQAFLTTMDGQRVGTFGDVCCFSLQQSKHISSGEGGVLATRNRAAYVRAALYSNSGIPSFRYGASASDAGFEQNGHLTFGHNHRMGELQGAVARVQLEQIDTSGTRRAELVAVAQQELARLGRAETRTVAPRKGADVSFWRYPVLVPKGRGTYRGIPPIEPIFSAIERTRMTPFGVEVRHDLHYGPQECPGAIEGAGQIRVLSMHHGQSDDEVRRAVGELVSDL